MTGPLAFTLNGSPVTLPPDVPPATSLLDWLRGPARLTGTKEGCAEGDCGACTVVIEEADGARIPVNACLTLLGQVQGKALRTVEGLAGPAGPHPIQQGLAEADGTQCGFCTPGIVMSLWAQAREGGDPHEALAGNLCRCTGYRPILDAMADLADDGAPPPALPERFARDVGRATGHHFFLPETLGETFALRAAHPTAWILAGGTDLGLRVSEHRERPAAVICLRDVAELAEITSTPEALTLGAALPYHTLLALFRAEPGFAPFAALLARLGSRQIRGMGTLGGNLGTASPIGDTLPVLLALGASIQIAGPASKRSVPADAFFLGYRQTALLGQELVRSVTLPRPGPGQFFDAQKLSKRHDQDIATVSLASLITVEGGIVTAARLALGGVAATPIRAAEAEAALIGAPFAAESFDAAARILAQNLAPLTDWRASADYRRLAAGNLLRRAFLRASRPDLPSEVMAIPAPHAPRFRTEGAP